MDKRHISVCICTYKRPEMLGRLLDRLQHQETNGAFTFSIVVADNDESRSAEQQTLAFAKQSPIATTYCSEPRKNIALVRNKTIENASGNFIAFIDDDEFPTDAWLATLLRACDDHHAAGALGPVKPHFESNPPEWLVKGRFCERAEYPTGTVLDAGKTRTGNVLFRREIINDNAVPFDPQFGTGGEDVDFFRRMIAKGSIFIWCNEAAVFETVPPSRWTRKYMLNRAMLRGKNTIRNPKGRFKLLAVSCVAIVLYIPVLIITLVIGQHVFMKYCIKFCDHLGRVLAFLGINPVNERQM